MGAASMYGKQDWWASQLLWETVIRGEPVESGNSCYGRARRLYVWLLLDILEDAPNAERTSTKVMRFTGKRLGEKRPGFMNIVICLQT